ncbi:hypothetical protein [Jannaschia sp. 2305UL9-9]|uniref:hypothetical protein n=1 Tax=Jannaschia sp. 2305UL9-9 TaxID=3121638 RepID=UPI0035288C04
MAQLVATSSHRARSFAPALKSNVFVAGAVEFLTPDPELFDRECSEETTIGPTPLALAEDRVKGITASSEIQPFDTSNCIGGGTLPYRSREMRNVPLSTVEGGVRGVFRKPYQ